GRKRHSLLKTGSPGPSSKNELPTTLSACCQVQRRWAPQRLQAQSSKTWPARPWHANQQALHAELSFIGRRGERMRKKVTVVGGGFVGSTTAQRIFDMELADVVLTDILDGPPAGKALDMLESGPITRTDSRARGISTANNDYSATAGSDVVVITAGFPRKPGMSRDDLLKANYDVVKAVVEQVVRHSPNCIIIVVTNPLDAMAQAAWKVSGFPKSR